MFTYSECDSGLGFEDNGLGTKHESNADSVPCEADIWIQNTTKRLESLAAQYKGGNWPSDYAANMRDLFPQWDESRIAFALLMTENAHGHYESSLGHRDSQWADWYARYLNKYEYLY